MGIEARVSAPSVDVGGANGKRELIQVGTSEVSSNRFVLLQNLTWANGEEIACSLLSEAPWAGSSHVFFLFSLLLLIRGGGRGGG